MPYSHVPPTVPISIGTDGVGKGPLTPDITHFPETLVRCLRQALDLSVQRIYIAKGS